MWEECPEVIRVIQRQNFFISTTVASKTGVGYISAVIFVFFCLLPILFSWCYHTLEFFSKWN